MTTTSPAAAVIEDLRTFSRLEGPTAVEEQTYLETEAGPVFATVATPRSSARRVALLGCHSFAWEQFELHPLELALLRSAAPQGFAAMLPQARGYGDSGGRFEDVTPATQVRDMTAASTELGARTSLPVVPVGPRFGASVALATAISIDAPGVALWDPPERPGRYLHQLLRALQVAGMTREEDEALGEAGPGMTEIKEAFAGGRTVDVFGYAVSARCYQEARAMDPLAGEPRVPGRTLIVTINPANRPSAERLASRLRELGSDVRVEEAQGPGKGDFGLGIPRAGHLATDLETFRDIVARTLAWAGETW